MNDSDDRKVRKYLWVIAASAGIVIGLTLLLYWYVMGYGAPLFGVSENNSDWANFGSFFGGALAPLMAFLALIALLYTINIQSRELRLTRRYAEESNVVLKSQALNMKAQAFESSFFNLVTLYTKLVSDFQYTYTPPSKYLVHNPVLKEPITVRGRYVIDRLYQELDEELSSALESNPYEDTAQKEHRVNVVFQAFERFGDQHGSNVFSYLRTVFNILGCIDRGELMSKEREYYASVFCSLLSSNELLILFYWLVSRRATCEFSALAKKYGLFRDLKPESLNHEAVDVAYLHDFLDQKSWPAL